MELFLILTGRHENKCFTQTQIVQVHAVFVLSFFFSVSFIIIEITCVDKLHKMTPVKNV